MHLLYTIGIYGYGLLMKLAALFHPKAKQWVDGRKNFFDTLPELPNATRYWFHCASLGEFDQALPVINLLKQKDPSLFIVVTFFSPSGFLHYHKRDHLADYVCYLPLDTPSNARKFVKHFQAEKVFFIKYEFWANYIFEIKKTSAKLYSISAIFRPEQHFFKKTGGFFRSVLHQFDYFFVQTNHAGDLLRSIGISNYVVTGDTRFDRVIENREKLKVNELIADFVQGEKAFIIGSSWPADEVFLLELINDGNIDIPVIIAPHDVSETHIQQLIQGLKIPFILYSELEGGRKWQGERILLIDTIGQLANAYVFGAYAYVGGGFSGSLHNILEPAVFGLPVIFGPKHSRFPEAEQFIAEGIAFSIENQLQLTDKLELVANSYPELRERIMNFVEGQAGASNKIIQFLELK